MQYFVYIIGNNIHEQSPYSTCYVGVTNNLDRRWKYHQKSNYRVGVTIREHHLTYYKNMKVILIGTEGECYELEQQLRPKPYIGLNEAVGGEGGHTKYTPERNKKISNALKGRPMIWGGKVSTTRILLGLSKGANNPRAKNWMLVSPTGDKYVCSGRVQDMCKELGLLWSTLNHHKNNIVPPITEGGYGGFRKKSDDQFTRRQNSTGWALYDQEI